MRRRVVVAGVAVAIGLTAVAAVLAPAGAPPAVPPAMAAQPADPISRAQERLRLVPGDWRTWAAPGPRCTRTTWA
ncbi:hypothetical protein [Phytohabitans kaempferiae]|uniref:Uncharacterized protein n=1 Tax=Phytohabitans kaempferiae TaxID=1620943 RepID=A0ABV6MD60_9ACTN